MINNDNPEIKKKVIVKDYTNQAYQEDDEKDFEVKGLRDEKLIDSVSGLDDQFEKDMFDISQSEDLPDSDRTLDCQTKGIDKKTCFDIKS